MAAVKRTRGLGRTRTWLGAGMAALTLGSMLAHPPAVLAAPVGYAYQITVQGSGSAQFDVSTCCVREKGNMSAAYTVVYKALVTVDHAARTVDFGPLDGSRWDGITGAESFEGVNSFNENRSCIPGSGCTGPDTNCSFTNIAVGQQYLDANNVYLQDDWGYGANNPTYESGVIRVTQRTGGVTPPGDPIKCSGTQTYTTPATEKMPGLQGPIAIPLEDIGEQKVVIESDVGPTSDWGLHQSALGSWHYTITLDLLNTDKSRIASATFPLTDRIEAAKRELKAKIDPLLAQHAELDKKLRDAEGQLAYAVAEHNRVVLHLQDLQQQIQDLRRDIESGIESADAERMKELRGFLEQAQENVRLWRLGMGGTEEKMRDLLVRRDDVAKKLLELAESLVALDFELRGLLVQADSKRVFAVDLTSPYPKLLQLDKAIEEQRKHVQELGELKEGLFVDARSAHKQATQQLSATADLIWSNALKKAAIDLATNVLDVLIAYSKDGWGGVATEVVGKVVETAIKDLVLDPYWLSEEPNPIKSEVKDCVVSFQAEPVGINVKALAIENGIKETGGEVAKDYLADGIKWLWPELEKATEGSAPSFDIRGVKESKTIIDRIKKLQPRLSTERFGDGFKKWGQNSFGRKVLTEAIKAIVERELKEAEMQAWRKYMEHDTRAQGLLCLWRTANNEYWEATDVLKGLELEKSRILKEFNPQTGQAIKLQESFSVPANLKIILNVPQSTKPFENVPIGVYVNGVEATRTFPKAFELSTKKLSTATELTIEVR